MNNVVITSASRTAIGSLGKTLKNTRADDLGSSVISKVIKDSKLSNVDIDEIIMGQVLTAGAGQNPASREVQIFSIILLKNNRSSYGSYGS